GIGGRSQDLITAAQKGIRAHFVPAGVRNLRGAWKISDERVLRDSPVFENAEAFCAQTLARHSIEMQNRGVRRETGEYGGWAMVLYPVEQVRERIPIRFGLQIEGARLRSGH